MKFKGTIVITDPCYLSEGMNNEDNLDLWDASEYGADLSLFGCSQWISESTRCGDWSCFTYKGTGDEMLKTIEQWNGIYLDFVSRHYVDMTYEEKLILHKEYEAKYAEFTKQHTYGQFSADAGMVCVVYLDEVLKVNPHFKEWACEHPQCVTIIENFDGDIIYEVDEEGDAHIVGKGNLDFYTSQSEF